MTPNDAGKFAQILTRTLKIYPFADTTADTIETWFMALMRFPLEDIMLALNRHVADPDKGGKQPFPSDVIAHLGGGAASRSLRAWSLVEKAIARAGMHRSVCFDDPIINKVIDEMGGWVKLSGIETAEDLKFRGIDFAKRYTGFMQVGGVGEDYPAYLLGVSESQNLSAGRVSQPPTLIGDAVKAQAVLERAKGSSALRLTQASPTKQIAGANLKLDAPTIKNENEGAA